MSILAEKTEREALQVITRSLKILEGMPAHVRISKNDDFEMSLAINMLKSILDNNPQIIIIKPPETQ